MLVLLFLSIPLFAGCLYILSVNVTRKFYRPAIFNSSNLYVRLKTSFLAAGGLILFAWCLSVTKTPFFRTYGDDVPPDIANALCIENSLNSSLPTTWFEEVNNEFLADSFEPFNLYCLVFFPYALCLFIEESWAEAYSKPVGELITLATSVMLPDDNWEEHKRTIVQRMISKIRKQDSHFYNFRPFASFSLRADLICVICYIINTFPDQRLAVRLNGSGWTVDCNRQATPQDLYSLKKCQFNSWNCKFGSICIVPTDVVNLHLRMGIALFAFMLAIICVSILLFKSHQIRKLGLRKMNDVLLVSLLKRNVDYSHFKEIIDEFERKLHQRSRDEALEPGQRSL